MKRIIKDGIIIGALFSLLAPSLAWAVTASQNYKIYGGQITPVSESVSSPNYQMDISANPIAGQVAGGVYVGQGGGPLEKEPDPAENTAVTGGSGIHLQSPAPKVTNLEIYAVSSRKILVDFNTDGLAVAYLQYGVSDDFNLQTKAEDSFSTSHEFLLTKLQPNAAYHFTIHLRGPGSNEVESIVYGFTTMPVLKLLPNVTNFRAAVKESTVILSWRNPAIDDLNAVKLIRNSGHFPKDDSDGELLFSGTDQSFVDSDVAVGGLYYYTVFVFDQDGNQSSGAATFVSLRSRGQSSTSTAAVLPTVILSTSTPSAVSSPPAVTPTLVPTTATLEAAVPEIPDGKAFQELIPTERLPLPENVRPLTARSSFSLKSSLIDFYSIVNEKTSQSYRLVAKYISGLTPAAQEQLRQVRSDLVDRWGNLSNSVYALLTPQERTQVEKIVAKPLPPVFDKSAVSAANPLVIKAHDYGADWHIFAGSDALISIPANLFGKSVELITATLANEAYVLQYNTTNGAYEALIKTPANKGKYQIIFQVIYTDHTFEEIDKAVLVDPYGYIYTEYFRPWSWERPWQFLTKEKVLMPFARVTIYTMNRARQWVVWPAQYFNQLNPQTTGVDGLFTFVVPPGQYYLVAQADGFESYRGPELTVIDRIVNYNIELHKSYPQWVKFCQKYGIIILVIVLVSAIFPLKKKFKIKRLSR